MCLNPSSITQSSPFLPGVKGNLSPRARAALPDLESPCGGPMIDFAEVHDQIPGEEVR
jgi:hypothetical protein